MWVPYLSLVAFFFLPKLTEPSEKKKKEKKKRKEKPRSDRSEKNKNKKEETQNRPKKKKKKRRTEQPRRKGKKSQKWSKVAAGTVCGSPFVCLVTILSLSYELWKLKTAKMCFQFP